MYYVEHATKRIAIAFLAEFERVVGLLQVNQKLGTPKSEGMRSYPFRSFPYSLIYREDEVSGPQVFAVAHQSRHPEYWQGRQL
jgi:plasmid stabilization system protein ParE